MFHFSLTLKDPMAEYQKMLTSVEQSLDPELDKAIEESPNRDWLRST